LSASAATGAATWRPVAPAQLHVPLPRGGITLSKMERYKAFVRRNAGLLSLFETGARRSNHPGSPCRTETPSAPSGSNC
jgi:hypothetical protein